MKNLFFLCLSLFATNVYSHSLECRGTGYNEPVYLSSNPIAPYDRFARKSCQFGMMALDGDLFIIFNATGKITAPCSVSGDMIGLHIIKENIHGNTLQLELQMGSSKVSDKFLKVDLTTGKAVYGNTLPNGDTIATVTLNCKAN